MAAAGEAAATATLTESARASVSRRVDNGVTVDRGSLPLLASEAQHCSVDEREWRHGWRGAPQTRPDTASISLQVCIDSNTSLSLQIFRHGEASLSSRQIVARTMRGQVVSCRFKHMEPRLRAALPPTDLPLPVLFALHHIATSHGGCWVCTSSFPFSLQPVCFYDISMLHACARSPTPLEGRPMRALRAVGTASEPHTASPATQTPSSVCLLGVSACGKTTIGKQLSSSFEAEFLDADDFHSADAKAKMKSGVALTDEDRAPWLARVGEAVAQKTRAKSRVVLACSALKTAYRDTLRSCGDPGMVFVLLDVSDDELKGTRNLSSGCSLADSSVLFVL